MILLVNRTLYGQLNQCVTSFGKRMLKNWLVRPLYLAESIRERQDAVAGCRVSYACLNFVISSSELFQPDTPLCSRIVYFRKTPDSVYFSLKETKSKLLELFIPMV